LQLPKKMDVLWLFSKRNREICAIFFDFFWGKIREDQTKPAARGPLCGGLVAREALPGDILGWAPGLQVLDDAEHRRRGQTAPWMLGPGPLTLGQNRGRKWNNNKRIHPTSVF